MSHREYKEHYVVQHDNEHLVSALAQAAMSGLMELDVLGDAGSTTLRVLDPQPQYWPNDELSQVNGHIATGSEVSIKVEPEELPTLYVWADRK